MPKEPTPDGADDDAACVARVRAGETAAYRALVERHERAVLGLLRWTLPRAVDRDDVAQEAFVAAWRRLDSYDASRGTFAAWLLTIARNLASNHRRGQRRAAKAVRGARGAEEGAPVEPGRSVPEGRIDDALASLPEEQRVVYVLAVVYEVPLAEVARIEDVPLGTVKSRLSRAGERLRAALADVVERVP